MGCELLPLSRIPDDRGCPARALGWLLTRWTRDPECWVSQSFRGRLDGPHPQRWLVLDSWGGEPTPSAPECLVSASIRSSCNHSSSKNARYEMNGESKKQHPWTPFESK